MSKELLQMARPLTLGERRWLAIHAMGMNELIGPIATRRTQQDPAEAARKLDAVGVSAYTGGLDDYQRGVLAAMPESLRYMLFPGEAATEYILPELYRQTAALLEKILLDPLFVAAYNADGWLYVEELQQCYFINQSHRRMYAKLYGLLTAAFQPSIRENSVRVFGDLGYRVERELRPQVSEGTWLTLQAKNIKIAAQKCE